MFSWMGQSKNTSQYKTEMKNVILEDASLKSLSPVNSPTNSPKSVSSIDLTIQTPPYVLPKPKRFIIEKKNNSNSQFNVLIIGCAGDGKEAQKKVAEALNDHIKKTGRQPDFIILLGDNFYDYGIDSPEDKAAYDDKFYGPYQNKELTGLFGIPIYVTFGNHDHNKWRKGLRGNAVDLKKVHAQIQHTYLDSKKAAEYRNEKIKLENLSGWNLPCRYYVLQSEDASVEFYFLDSNTYVYEYLRTLQNKDDQYNQSIWLANEMQKNPKAKKFLFMHHIAGTTLGKRFEHTDANHYLDQDDINQLKHFGFSDHYNKMLGEIFAKQGLIYEAVFGAHDHSMSFVLEKNHCQVIAGGGGGPLQPHCDISKQHKVGAFLENFGFWELSVSEKDVYLDAHTVKFAESLHELHLRFNIKHLNPILPSSEELSGTDVTETNSVNLAETKNNAEHIKLNESKKIETKEVALLRAIIIKACKKYFVYLNEVSHNTSEQSGVGLFSLISHTMNTGAQAFKQVKQQAGYGDFDIRRTDYLLNHFNQSNQLTLENAVALIDQILGISVGTIGKNDQLVAIIRKELSPFCQKYDLLLKEIVKRNMLILVNEVPVHDQKNLVINPIDEMTGVSSLPHTKPIAIPDRKSILSVKSDSESNLLSSSMGALATVNTPNLGTHFQDGYFQGRTPPQPASILKNEDSKKEEPKNGDSVRFAR